MLNSQRGRGYPAQTRVVSPGTSYTENTFNRHHLQIQHTLTSPDGFHCKIKQQQLNTHQYSSNPTRKPHASVSGQLSTAVSAAGVKLLGFGTTANWLLFWSSLNNQQVLRLLWRRILGCTIPKLATSADAHLNRQSQQ